MTKPSKADAVPLAPSLFAEAVTVGLAAGESDGGGPVTVDRPAADGSVSLLELPDSPHTRAAFALKRHFADDPRAFHSALARFRALMDLFSRGVLAPWCRRSGDARSALHPAVIDVASRMRLSPNGRFAPRKFTAAVAEAADANYRDLEWPRD